MRHLRTELPIAWLAFAFLWGCGGLHESPQGPPGSTTKKDDWSFSPSSAEDSRGNATPTLSAGPSTGAAAPTPTTPTNTGGTIGLAAGGAKDANNFRENIANDYLPLTTDITYEGVFYDYYFDTGARAPCPALFCPSYAPMLSTDPLSQTQEPYLSVGLNSGIKESDFARKRLNLVVVLDISGSMGSAFNSYYYDQAGNQVANTEDAGKSKMAIANESIVAMLGHLRAGDRFGMVLFDDTGYLAKPLSPVEDTDMQAIAGHILDLEAMGGTNMEAGYKLGSAMLAELGAVDPANFEDRIIFLTDAMPNTGDISADSLAGMVASNALARIFTTFIGIGVDFNSSLIELLTKTKGANYYSVHGSQEFKERLDEEFDFMVTPLVFDLKLALQSDGLAIKEVFGSPEANLATGQLLFVNTLFPSKAEGGESKGGIILALLERMSAANEINLSASYEDRNGVAATNDSDFSYLAPLDQAPNLGIRKAVLLVRYVRLVKAWIVAERQAAAAQAGATYGSEWERQSLPLVVSEPYRTQFRAFASYFKTEMAAIGDEALAQEAKILDRLAP
ncbi:MAG: VWA domain-containing protein [Deltaproteobacteria bacterium]|jgi:Ca-activated chloride channel family protein|nr:VWA domain-containing protein [Deltaproteobacteria bacterium]